MILSLSTIIHWLKPQLCHVTGLKLTPRRTQRRSGQTGCWWGTRHTESNHWRTMWPSKARNVQRPRYLPRSWGSKGHGHKLQRNRSVIIQWCCSASFPPVATGSIVAFQACHDSEGITVHTTEVHEVLFSYRRWWDGVSTGSHHFLIIRPTEKILELYTVYYIY